MGDEIIQLCAFFKQLLRPLAVIPEIRVFGVSV
jgi:hypothetical protein